MTGPRRSDDDLLDLVQRQTLAYFWDFAHPASGMARERSNPAHNYDYRDTVTSGGTGFGIMALLAGAERGFLPRSEVLDRILGIVEFLGRAESYHGVFPHFLHGATGATIPFSEKDDGGDLVETSYLIMGLLCARQYFAAGRHGKRACARPSTGCGMPSSGTGTPAAARSCTGTGARGMAGRRIMPSPAGTSA